MCTLNGRIGDDEEDDEEAHEEPFSIAGEEREDATSDKDALSLVSEDSELSVGHENAVEAERNALRELESKNLNAPKKYEDLCKDIQPEPLINPFFVANAIQIPVPVMLRAHSSPFFQQGLLRNSHLYAEELVMHQMQLMTAARVNALTKAVDCDGRSNLKALTQISALTEMSRIAAAAYMASAHATKKKVQIETGDNKCLCTYHSNIYQHSEDCPVHIQGAIGIDKAYNACNNVNLNEPTLKFSIDNILKSDFGRRMDFVNKHCSHHNIEKEVTKKYFQCLEQDERVNSRSESIVFPASMDLTNLITCGATTATTNTSTLNYCSTLSNICTNSNDSLINAAANVECASGSKTKSIQESFVYKKQHQNTEECKSPDNTSLSSSNSKACSNSSESEPIVWPAWVYCTRYSDRPSSGPRTRKPKKSNIDKGTLPTTAEDKRPRTAFSGSQLARLKHEFTENRYLTEKRRQQLSSELGLNEAQIKIWFQNKRAKLKKSSGTKNPLALQLMAQGLYNHSTMPLTREEEELQELEERNNCDAERIVEESVNN